MGTLISHRKARFDYEILETFEAGIELKGFEVKSLRGKRGNLEGGRVIFSRGEAHLVGVHIPPYQAANAPRDYDPERTRRLLLNKKELVRIATMKRGGGLTIIPLSVYGKGRRIKVEIGIVRGRKKHDKRELIRKREAEREMRRTLKYE